MKEIKKGIAPMKENNTQTQCHSSRFQNVCLGTFYAGLILFFIGQYVRNDALWGFGIGITFGMMIIQFLTNPIKEDEDER